MFLDTRSYSFYVSAINHSQSTRKLGCLHKLCLSLVHFKLSVRKFHELAQYFRMGQRICCL